MESFNWQMNAAVVKPKMGIYGRLKGANMQQLANTEHNFFTGRTSR
ncbi:MAG: hypothetical protein ACJASG_002046 [Oleiphilaceae bacterium]|jgi:hypothetical protein